MKTSEHQRVNEVRARLVDVAGRTTQDLGLGRIVGQVLCHVYLTEGESSLDDIGDTLGLSKAAVSIAARQLENLGLIERVWKKGDRKHYYRLVGEFGAALRRGILGLVRGKVRAIGVELDQADALLKEKRGGHGDAEEKFLQKRIARACRLRKRAAQLMDSPIVKLLGG